VEDIVWVGRNRADVVVEIPTTLFEGLCEKTMDTRYANGLRSGDPLVHT
jgi:hypothetical protein